MARQAPALANRARALTPNDITIFRQRLAAIEPDALIAYFANVEDLWWLLSDAQQRRLLAFRPEAFDGDTSAWGLVLGQVYHARGDERRARACADSSIRAHSPDLGFPPLQSALQAADRRPGVAPSPR